MKRFRFRLETVEKVRRLKEDEKLRQLGEMQKRVKEFQQHQEQLNRDLAASLMRREELGGEPIPGVAFQMESEFIAGTKTRREWVERQIFRAQKNMQKAMKEYILARRNTMAMETLRRKEEESFRIEMNRKEQKRIDDLMMMRRGIVKLEGEAE